MKKSGVLVSIGIQVFAVMVFASAAMSENGPVDKARHEAGGGFASGALINAAIDVLAGAHNPDSPFYDKEFAQATTNDFRQLFLSARRLAQHDDFDQLVTSLDKVMALNDNPDPRKNTLAKYLKQVLKGVAPIMQPEPIKGLLVSLSSIDPACISGANGIVKGLDLTVTNNIYGQNRLESDINTSSLRSLLIMFASADYVPTFVVRGKDTGIPYLSMVDSPDHPPLEPGTVSDQTHNLAEWAIGEIVTALRWGREGKIKQGGRYVHMDQFQAFDWLMFKKRYRVSGHGYDALKFEGVISVAADRIAQVLVPAALVEAFPAALELGGGVKDVKHRGGDEGCFTNTPWRTVYGTAGERHKLLALAAPVLEYFWYARDHQGKSRVSDLVGLVVSLNEIPCTDYRSLDAGPQATFRNDEDLAGKSVLKIIEDSGVMNALLRPHGTDDTGLAAPLLDLIIRVIAKMNTPQSVPAEYLRMNPGFQGDTLLDAVFAEISSAAASLSRSSAAKDDPIEGVIDALFKPLPGRTESPATILEKIAFVTARAARDKQFVAVFKADLDRLVDASEKMLMSADLEKIYKGLDMILALNDDPDPEKNTLARFMKNAVSGIAVNMDEEDIKGLIMTMASIDQSAYQGRDGVSEGIVQLMERNMYGQVRATAEVKTCALRSLLFLLPQRSRIRHLTLAGIETDIPLPSVLDSPDHPENEPGTVKNITTDTTEWAIGEIVTAVRWGREGKITMNGRSVPLDQFQAFDWVMYKKRYTIHVAGMHLPFMSFDGLAGMLSSPLVPLILPAAVTDVLPAVFEVAGGMSDAEYASGAMSGFTEESWKDRYGTAGRRHKLLALMVPLMEYAWNTRDEQGRPLTGALLKSLEGLNEIPLPPAYEPLKGFTGKNPRATLRRDDEPGVLKTLQDSDLLVYVMQPRGDNDILLPAMNLFGLIVAKLSEKDSGLIYREAHPEFTGNTLMDALLNEMSLRVNVAQSDTTQRLVDQVIKALFVPRSGDSVNLVSRMQGYIHRIVSGLYGDPAGTRAASRD